MGDSITNNGQRSFKEMVLGSAVWFALGICVTSFTAGIYSHETIVRWLGQNGQAKDEANKPKASYTESVEAFLNPKSEPPPDYELKGFAQDLTQLNSLVQQFLRYLSEHHTTYPDAQDFYVDMGDAADLVTRRALSTFNSPGDQALPNLAYNWKVYCGPSKFRLYIHDLSDAHMAGISGQQIAAFQNKFNFWREKEAGVQ
jgi:hypothetical protein